MVFFMCTQNSLDKKEKKKARQQGDHQSAKTLLKKHSQKLTIQDSFTVEIPLGKSNSQGQKQGQGIQNIHQVSTIGE